MLEINEDMRNEFKVKLTDKFESEAIAFLNSNGGNIYIGINDYKDKSIRILDFKNNKISELQNAIISLMLDSPTITQAELAKLLNTSMSTIQRNIKELINIGIVQRIGATKKGEWKVINTVEKND